jgi:hypothetical protein
MPRVEVITELDTVTCYRTDCGLQFAVPVLWLENKRRDHSDFTCPNGHHQAFLGKTKEEQVRDELKRSQETAEYYRKRNLRLEDDKTHLKRSISAQRGQVPKLRNKAIRGECWFCHQQFADVAAHVQTEHPGETAEDDQADE